jgi:hypothetical protein
MKRALVFFLPLFFFSLVAPLESSDWPDSLRLYSWAADLPDNFGFSFLYLYDFFGLSELAIFFTNTVVLFVTIWIYCQIGPLRRSALLTFLPQAAFGFLLTKEPVFSLGVAIMVFAAINCAGNTSRFLKYILIGFGICFSVREELAAIYLIAILVAKASCVKPLRVQVKYVMCVLLGSLLFQQTIFFENIVQGYFGNSKIEDFGGFTTGFGLMGSASRFLLTVPSVFYNAVSGFAYNLNLLIAVGMVFTVSHFKELCRQNSLFGTSTIDLRISFPIWVLILCSLFVPFIQIRYLLPALPIIFLTNVRDLNFGRKTR